MVSYTLVTPATMGVNGYVYGNSTTVGSTSALFSPTTAITYQIKMDQGSGGGAGGEKIGLLVMTVAASSVNTIRCQVGLSKSTDYLGWQGGYTSTDVKTFYCNQNVAASSTEYLILGPFEGSRYANFSTAGYKVLNFTVDAAAAATPQSTLSTTLAAVCTTIKVLAFTMP